MPQLPITIPSAQPPAAAAGQQSAAAAFGADAGDAPEGLQGLDFGSILGKQLKGAANALIEQMAGAKTDGSAELGEDAEQPAVASAPAFFQVDFAAMAATPTPVVMQQGSLQGGGSPQAAEAKPILDLVRTEKPGIPAEIAGGGKNLPQGISDEKLFADKLAALVESSSAKADSLSANELPTAVRAHEGAVAVMVPPRQVDRPPVVTVAPAVGSTEWGGAVGEKVVWMSSQNHQVAELHLNPPSLGPLEVRLTVNNDQATALFVSHHAAVRDAIETALPRLREMLADNGIMLGNATVSSESFGQQQAFDQGSGKGRGAARGGDAMASPLGGGGLVPGLSRDGMVDIFA